MLLTLHQSPLPVHMLMLWLLLLLGLQPRHLLLLKVLLLLQVQLGHI
jgi:hypothetical protein